METVRERIIDLLFKERNPLTAHQIAELLELDEKEGEEIVYSSILHIAKSVRRRYGKILNMIPPMCTDCGFVLNKVKASKCPRCRSQRISPARFFIK